MTPDPVLTHEQAREVADPRPRHPRMTVRYVCHLSYFAGGVLRVRRYDPQFYGRGTWWATRAEAAV